MLKYSGAALAALLALGAAAKADPVMPGAIERYTYTYVTPSGGDFSGSTFIYNNTINFDGVAGERDETVNFKPVAAGINLYGQGGTTVSIPTAADGTLFVNEAFTSPGGTGQGYGFDYDGGTSAVFGDSFLMPGTVGGLEALFFNGGGTNLLDDGGRFLSSVVIDGDWSSSASHTAATFASGYVIDQDFVYDAISGKTTFSIETDDYVAGVMATDDTLGIDPVNPAISFALLGDPVDDVPEPMSLALFGAGLAGAFVIRRKRKG
jgi:PEP-CTERM motif